MAESINTGILQQSVGLLDEIRVMHSGTIPGAPAGRTGAAEAGAAAGAGAAGGAGGALCT